MAEVGSKEWFRDPKVSVEDKRAVAKARALAGPQSKFWRRYFELQDDAMLVDEEGQVYRVRPEP